LGTTVTITGMNFIGTSEVSFGGVAAGFFSVQSPTTIRAVVLGGASGYVRVTTSEGSDSLPGFTYTAPKSPAITSISPASGAVGTVVTILGHDFSTDTALNYVYFGPAKAKVTSASSNALVVIAPTGASYGNISVTANSLTALSPYP